MLVCVLSRFLLHKYSLSNNILPTRIDLRQQSTSARLAINKHNPDIMSHVIRLVALLTLCVGLVPTPCSAGANILAVFPSDYRSHLTLGSALFTALAERGHNVLPSDGIANS